MSARSETATQTRATCALVLLGDLEAFAALKKQAERLGMKIVYQRSTAPWVKLWIEEGGRGER